MCLLCTHLVTCLTFLNFIFFKFLLYLQEYACVHKRTLCRVFSCFAKISLYFNYSKKNHTFLDKKNCNHIIIKVIRKVLMRFFWNFPKLYFLTISIKSSVNQYFKQILSYYLFGTFQISRFSISLHHE